MKVDIYRSKNHEWKFILFESDLIEINLSVKDKDFDEIVLHKANVDLNTMNINKIKAEEEINYKGHFIWILSGKADEILK